MKKDLQSENSRCRICGSPDHSHLHCYGTAAQTKEQRYEQALRDILDPIGKVRRELPEGYVLNGAACVQSLKDPETYKAIARAALEGT